MKITQITKENEIYFEPFFPDSVKAFPENVIRIGVVDTFDNVAGALCARVYDGFTDILSIYILKKYRRRSFGSALINRLYEMVNGTGNETFISEFLDDPDMVIFFKTMGFELFPGRVQYMVYLREFLRSPMYKKHIADKDHKKVKTVSEMGEGAGQAIASHFGPIDYDVNWSTVNISDGILKSCMLSTHDKNNISIKYLYSVSGDPAEVFSHIRFLVARTLSVYSEDDAVIRMVFEQDKHRDFFMRLLGGSVYLHPEGRYMRAVKIV